LAPDREGKLENIVLGFDSIEEYERHSSPYFGAVVGRFAGRIKEGRFTLDGQEYQVTKNENQNHLHGGNKGFSKVLWDYNVGEEKENEISIEFCYFSPNGEEGYPGSLDVKVIYSLTNENELIITYYGKSDKKTLLNMTNHTYFNLSGDLKRDILYHELTIKSDKFIELDDELLPTGNLIDVKGTVFDFRKGRKIITGVKSTHPQILLANKGFDHPFLLNTNHQQEIILYEKESGRKLVIETDEPSVVLYTGNKLGEQRYKIRNVNSKNYLGLCLETQAPPDSVHHPHFHSSILNENNIYRKRTKYLFASDK
ncbi:galactose mutarotase, partial [Aeribacillus composti]|nr:galactose mutarotase [Aeribacillus composti]